MKTLKHLSPAIGLVVLVGNVHIDVAIDIRFMCVSYPGTMNRHFCNHTTKLPGSLHYQKLQNNPWRNICYTFREDCRIQISRNTSKGIRTRMYRLWLMLEHLFHTLRDMLLLA